MSTATDLKSRIDADMKAAMRAREKVRLGALRLLLAAIKQKEVDERTTLDDAQVLAIVEKLSKQRRDSIEQFEKAGRTDLAEQERAELAVLDTYRPAQADDAQIQAVIEAGRPCFNRNIIKLSQAWLWSQSRQGLGWFLVQKLHL